MSMTRRLPSPVTATCPACGASVSITHEVVPTGSSSPGTGPWYVTCPCGESFWTPERSR